MFRVERSRSARSAVNRSDGANIPPTCFTVTPLPDCGSARRSVLLQPRHLAKDRMRNLAPWHSRHTSSSPALAAPADRCTAASTAAASRASQLCVLARQPARRLEGNRVLQPHRLHEPGIELRVVAQFALQQSLRQPLPRPLFNRRARRVHADLPVEVPQNIRRAPGARARSRRLVHRIHHPLGHKLVQIALHIRLQAPACRPR